MTLTDQRTAISGGLGSLTIDGVAARRVLQLDEPEQVAGILRQASEDDEAVYPVGSGLHQRFGRTPESVDVALSTRGLSGLIRYDPADLVVSVGAGTTLAELQTELAVNGQWLPVETPGGADATIGGLLALNLMGPRQLGSLSLRDLLLGMAVAQTDGTVVKSGGMVVKNVSGFDMGRLHVGACGTLGVITSANFKVLPRPATEATTIAVYEGTADGLGAAFAAYDRLRASPLRPVAADVSVSDGAAWLAVRFEGRPGAVQRQLATATELLGGDRETLPDPHASRQWWTKHVARLGFEDLRTTVLRIEARPRQVAADVASLIDALPEHGLAGGRLVVSPGLGLAWLHLDEASREAVAGLVARLRDGGLALTVMSAPPAWKADLESGEERRPRPIDLALREQFDPAGILNRGRYPIA